MKRKGFALISVIAVLIIVSVTVSVMMIYLRQNTIEIIRITEDTQNYHFAEAGIEIGYTTLFQTNPAGGDLYISGLSTTTPTMNYVHEFRDGTVANNLVGTANITIEVVTIGGQDWALITSIGQATHSDRRVTSTMRIDLLNHFNTVRASDRS